MKRSLTLLILASCLLSIVLTVFNIDESYATPAQYEYYTATPNYAYAMYGVFWGSQSFTIGTVGPNHAMNATSVKFKAYRLGYPDMMNVSIRNIAYSWVPTGNDIYSGLINASTFTVSTAGAWYTVNFTTWDGSTYLQGSTKYAIVFRVPSGTVGNVAYLLEVNPGGYSGGNAVHSSDSGATWSLSARDADFEVWGEPIWGYTLEGLFDEETGLLYPVASRAVNVTAYFEDASSETFEVNGSYVYSPASQPLYFVFHLAVPRQYWLSTIENIGDTFYIFNGSQTTYDIEFFDLGGVTETMAFVSAKRLINGSYFTVDKRKFDATPKLQFGLVQGEKYTLVISDTTESYTFGELLTTADTTITLTLRGIDFPKATLLTYKYVRIYGLRGFSSPIGNITITYEDTLNLTISVYVEINYRNGTTAYSTTETTSSFIVSWLSADNNTDYQVVATITHERYGTYSWKQFMPRSYSTNPWVLGWLGNIDININNAIAVVIVIFVGAGFSMINPEVGAFLACCAAAALTIMGWLPLAPGLLIAAFCFTIMFGMVIAKRRVQYG